MANELPQIEEDPFALLPERYPVAWKAITNLSQDFKKEKAYLPIQKREMFLKDLKRVKKSYKGSKAGGTVIQSGMDPNIDTQTLKHLRSIKNNPMLLP